MSFTLSKVVDSAKIFLTRKSESILRCDPHFHSPRFASLAEQLNRLESVTIRKISTSIFSGTTPLSGGDAYADDPNAIAFIRSGDFNEDGSINEEELIRLKAEVHEKLMRRSQLKKNDVLFAIVGVTIGKVGIFLENYEANINQAVCAVRFAKGLLPQFAHAFFLTSLGKEQIERLKRPVARANINLEEIGTLQIPLLKESKQQEVVFLLKKAFANKAAIEAKALNLLRSIDNVLLDELDIKLKAEPPNTVERRMFRRAFSEICGGRFDPIANQEKRRMLEKAIYSSRYPVHPLIKMVGVAKTIVDAIAEGESYVGLENIASDTGEFIATSDKESVGTAVQFMPGQILFPKLRPYLNKTHLATFSGICSTEFHVFTPQGINGDYLTAYLRSRAIVGITSLLMTGNTLPRLQKNDIEKLPIPVPPLSVQIKLNDKISKLKLEAKALRNKAKIEMEKAKREIETLILGEKGDL